VIGIAITFGLAIDYENDYESDPDADAENGPWLLNSEIRPSAIPEARSTIQE
jgi:hypothetical protein